MIAVFFPLLLQTGAGTISTNTGILSRATSAANEATEIITWFVVADND